MSRTEQPLPVIPDAAKEIPPAVHAANEGVFVSLQDIERKGSWENHDGAKVRIKSLDPPVLTDYETGQDVFFESPEAIRQKLQEEEFVFSPAQTESESVSDQTTTRIPVHAESPLLGDLSPADMKRIQAEASELDVEIGQLLAAIGECIEQMNASVTEANTYSSKEGFEGIKMSLDAISSEAEGIGAAVNTIADTDDAADKNAALTQEDIAEKQKRREQLREFSQKMEVLAERAVQELESAKMLAFQPGRTRREAPEKKVRVHGKGKKKDSSTSPAKPVVTPDGERPKEAAVGTEKDDNQKILDAFLERPKAREKVAMFEDIIREEWDAFEQYSHKESLKMEGRLSFRDKMALWEKKGLPALEEMVARHLNRFDGIDLEKGQTIFRAILRNLEEEAKKER